VYTTKVAELLRSVTLGRIVKNRFQITLTEIISERIVMEAKRELNLTSKTIKEIAYELGFKSGTVQNAKTAGNPLRKQSIILGSLAIVTAIF
jgi:methylphosphotriester-DNA--protein-cysteine methyltransferase